ncbi:hypothetical protein C0J52_25027 [Blattella germanica]|nr:hypothetical protein C0J52_25027 [Blattella germanica]
MSPSGVKFSGVKIVPQAKHRDIFLGTWNVRTLCSNGALEILTRELDRTDLDIESGKFTLYYGGATKPEFGTGILVRRSILSAIRDIKFVSDRISYIILKGKRHDFIIVNLNGIHKLLVYADDIVLLGDSEEILKDNMHILKININKTKYMVTCQNVSCNANGQLMTKEGNFEEVAEFKYLGALITNRNEIQKEIKHTLNSGNACYYALLRLLSSEEKRLRVFENNVLRKIFGPKKDKETGEWRKIKSHRLRWAGHVVRMEDERGVRRILEGKPDGKHPVRRPRMKWENNINHDLREVDYTGYNWKTLGQDRDVWRAYVRTTMNLRVR